MGARDLNYTRPHTSYSTWQTSDRHSIRNYLAAVVSRPAMHTRTWRTVEKEIEWWKCTATAHLNYSVKILYRSPYWTTCPTSPSLLSILPLHLVAFLLPSASVHPRNTCGFISPHACHSVITRIVQPEKPPPPFLEHSYADSRRCPQSPPVWFLGWEHQRSVKSKGWTSILVYKTSVKPTAERQARHLLSSIIHGVLKARWLHGGPISLVATRLHRQTTESQYKLSLLLPANRGITILVRQLS